MLFQWYKDISETLKKEPETWLAYLCSQQFQVFQNIAKSRNYRSLSPQLIRFCFGMLRQWTPFHSHKGKHVDYFVFTSAINQMRSLDSTIDSIERSHHNVKAISLKHYLKQQYTENRYSALSLNTLDIVKTLVLVARYSPSLYKEIKKTNAVAASSHYSEYLWIYAYLVYFHRALSELTPSFVLTANDLNPSNRSLLAIAHQLEIRTVYLQHASVTNIFPALRVTYAFLDGSWAMETYKQCEKNQFESNSSAVKPKILLTGQKKLIYKSKDTKKRVGIALNALDDFEKAISDISDIINPTAEVTIRWHPTQPKSDIDKLSNHFLNDNRVRFSDPLKEPVGSFLMNISYLVAGNSSIHLEAALAGVLTIYYEFTKQNNPDYYGYVKNGLAQQAHSINEVQKIVKQDLSKTKNYEEAIKYYSATYSTVWEGREGELVAKCLESILENDEPPIPVLSL